MNSLEKYTKPTSWGTGVWFGMHTLAAFATTPERKRAFLRFIRFLLAMLLDPASRKFSLDYLDKYPPELMMDYVDERGDRIGLFKWTWQFHNAANVEVSKTSPQPKPFFPWASAYELFLKPGAGVCTTDCGDDPEDPASQPPAQPSVISTLYNGQALNGKSKYADPKLFGPGLWFVNHIYAYQIAAESEKAPQLKLDYLEYIYLIVTMIKCQTCQNHATQYVKDFPPCDLKNDVDEYGETGLLKWTWIFHNAVNERIKKDPYPYQSLINMCLAANACRLDPHTVPPTRYLSSNVPRNSYLSFSRNPLSEDEKNHESFPLPKASLFQTYDNKVQSTSRGLRFARR